MERENISETTTVMLWRECVGHGAMDLVLQLEQGADWLTFFIDQLVLAPCAMNRATPCSGLDTVWIDKGLHVATKIRQAPQTATSSEMLQRATSFVARAQLSAASRSVRDASRDFSATEAPDTATMSMPSTPSLSGTVPKTSQPRQPAQHPRRQAG